MLRLLIAACSLLVALVWPALTGAQQVNHLVRVQQLSLESLAGKVLTHYSPGARARATALQKMLDEAKHTGRRSVRDR